MKAPGRALLPTCPEGLIWDWHDGDINVGYRPITAARSTPH